MSRGPGPNAIGAVILSLAGILFYIWIRLVRSVFLAAIMALCHDVIIVIGFLALSAIWGLRVLLEQHASGGVPDRHRHRGSL